MDTKEKIEIMSKFSSGKRIQMRKSGETDIHSWTTIHDPSWDWENYEYRVFIELAEAYFYEYLSDNIWKMTSERYVPVEFEKMAEENGYDGFHTVEALGVQDVEVILEED